MIDPAKHSFYANLIGNQNYIVAHLKSFDASYFKKNALKKISLQQQQVF